MKWIVGIVGGLCVFVFVALISYFISSFFLLDIHSPSRQNHTFLKIILPVTLGLLAGAHSCRASVRRAQDKAREKNNRSTSAKVT